MLEPLYTAAEMRAAEEGYDVEELMERAGRAVAAHTLERFPHARAFTVVCGAGANGGDGRITASALREAGRDARVIDAKPEDARKELGFPDVLVDALFGTGFSGEPRPGAAALIEQMNEVDAPIVAVDIPSGVDASTGEVRGAAVFADLTVTFHGEKLGLAVAPGRFHAGDVVVADIGLDPRTTEYARVTSAILEEFPLRGEIENKYTAGHVIVVGGSPGLTGAPCLAAMAALRADAGYVTIAAPASTLPVFEQRLLEPVKRPLPEDDAGRLTIAAADAILEIADPDKEVAVALGPGLGRSADTRALVHRLLRELEAPVVVDADGLWELEPFDRPFGTVLTPHAGELARLLGRTASEVDAHRLESVREAAKRFDCVVVLKGADTLVAEPELGVVVSDHGPPSLATAGTGDVLTGVVAAFLAKGWEPFDAAEGATVAHGLAGRLVANQAGLIASDLLDALPRVLS